KARTFRQILHRVPKRLPFSRPLQLRKELWSKIENVNPAVAERRATRTKAPITVALGPSMLKVSRTAERAVNQNIFPAASPYTRELRQELGHWIGTANLFDKLIPIEFRQRSVSFLIRNLGSFQVYLKVIHSMPQKQKTLLIMRSEVFTGRKLYF